MGGTDFLLGLILARLFGFGSGARRPAEVFAPGSPGSPSSPSSPSSPPLLPGTAHPQFPTNVDVPEPSPIPLPPPPAGFVKSVEVWRVKPSTQETAAVLVGAGASLTMRDLEKNFPRGWHAVPNVTAAEVAAAKALLPSWEEGKIIFAGPDTPSERRAFRMTKHPRGTNPATAKPAPVGPPSTTIPASSTTAPTAPSSAPGPLPPPEEMQRPPGATLITAIRKGEGLAQRAKALGRPENAASAAEFQAANVPDGPGDVVYEKTALAQGGLKKKGRKGGLQPGDPLFVPRAWGPIDPARL
jgi:hypothetical protein